MNVTYVIYRRSTPMGDPIDGAMFNPIDGAMFNKCDPVRLGISSSVSVENNLFCTHCKKFQQISTNNIKDTST